MLRPVGQRETVEAARCAVPFEPYVERVADEFGTAGIDRRGQARAPSEVGSRRAHVRRAARAEHELGVDEVGVVAGLDLGDRVGDQTVRRGVQMSLDDGGAGVPLDDDERAGVRDARLARRDEDKMDRRERPAGGDAHHGGVGEEGGVERGESAGVDRAGPCQMRLDPGIVPIQRAGQGHGVIASAAAGEAPVDEDQGRPRAVRRRAKRGSAA